MSKFGKCSEYYTGKNCVKCGRNRVIAYSNDFEICEKCNWCPQLNRHVLDNEFYDEEEYNDWINFRREKGGEA